MIVYVYVRCSWEVGLVCLSFGELSTVLASTLLAEGSGGDRYWRKFGTCACSKEIMSVVGKFSILFDKLPEKKER